MSRDLFYKAVANHAGLSLSEVVRVLSSARSVLFLQSPIGFLATLLRWLTKR
jgi:hypothetical protein